MQAQQTLMILPCLDKNGQRVWAVQSTSGTKAAGHLVFHILTWDASAAAWHCGCPSRKPCVHIRMASDASRAEQQRADVAFDALTAALAAPQGVKETDRLLAIHDALMAEHDAWKATQPKPAEPIMARNDSGPRWLMGAQPLAERVREVM